MNTTIRLRIKKEVDTPTARKILTLKGSLIAKSYTDIIHFVDESEEYYIHYFTTDTSKRQAALGFITSLISESELSGHVNIVE